MWHHKVSQNITTLGRVSSPQTLLRPIIGEGSVFPTMPQKHLSQLSQWKLTCADECTLRDGWGRWRQQSAEFPAVKSVLLPELVDLEWGSYYPNEVQLKMRLYHAIHKIIGWFDHTRIISNHHFHGYFGVHAFSQPPMCHHVPMFSQLSIEKWDHWHNRHKICQWHAWDTNSMISGSELSSCMHQTPSHSGFKGQAARTTYQSRTSRMLIFDRWAALVQFSHLHDHVSCGDFVAESASNLAASCHWQIDLSCHQVSQVSQVLGRWCRPIGMWLSWLLCLSIFQEGSNPLRWSRVSASFRGMLIQGLQKPPSFHYESLCWLVDRDSDNDTSPANANQLVGASSFKRCSFMLILQVAFPPTDPSDPAWS